MATWTPASAVPEPRAQDAGTVRRTRSRQAFPWQLLLPALPVVLAALAGVLGPWVAPHSPTSNHLLGRLKPPLWRDPGGAITCWEPICWDEMCSAG